MNLTLQRKKSFQANDLIHDQFVVLGKIDNKKHSSTILKGFDKIAHTFVVIKITNAAYKEKNKIVTKILQKLRGGTGVPKIIWRGMEGQNTITVTECLGPNLKKLFLLMDKQFTIGTIAQIAIQILNTLESIHSHDYVCCNIMPKEILISLHKKCMTLYITDYKQARKVKSSKGAYNEQNGVNKAILNKFSSVNLHLGLPPSKKDDLESLAYILIYFFKKGNLFEKTAKFSTKEEKIKFYEQQKLSLTPATFCRGLPEEMGLFMNYVKHIQVNPTGESLDYDYARKLFKSLFQKHASHSPLDHYQYDWMKKAIIYNMDPNTNNKVETEKINPSELVFKSEILSFRSSRNPESDSCSLDDKRKDSLTLSPFMSTNAPTSTLDECDFYGTDESPTLSWKSEPLIIQPIEVFQERVKSFQEVKKRNNGVYTLNTYRDTYRETTQDDEYEKYHAKTVLLTTQSEDYGRVKFKSVTEVTKLSKFGKNYIKKK